MLSVQPEDALAHRQVLVPAAELYPGAGEGVVPVHDRRVERRDERRVQEIEQVRRGGAQPLDRALVEPPNGGQDLRLRGATGAGVEEAAEGALVVGVLVDVGNAQLRLPQPRVIGPLEELPLLSHGMYDCLEGRPAVGIAERPDLDLRHHLGDAPADGAEVLEALLPEEP